VRDEIIPENNGQFLWKVSEHESVCKKVTDGKPEICLTIAELTEFVFGKREVKGLEDIKVLSKICINEAV
jgi:predicted acetyltransferase